MVEHTVFSITFQLFQKNSKKNSEKNSKKKIPKKDSKKIPKWKIIFDNYFPKKCSNCGDQSSKKMFQKQKRNFFKKKFEKKMESNIPFFYSLGKLFPLLFP